jgi:hypothetical protein
MKQFLRRIRRRGPRHRTRQRGTSDESQNCECLAPIDRISPPWAGKYEKHLRSILEKNSDRFVRCSAQFALASVVRSTGESREDEAAILYQQFIDQFKEHTNPGTSHIEEMYVDRARTELARIKAFAIGQPAPEIEGPGRQR